MKFSIGEEIQFNCIDGFAVNAIIIGTRKGSHPYQIQYKSNGNVVCTWAMEEELETIQSTYILRRDTTMRDTHAHVQRVGELMMKAVSNLQDRAIHHDASKFGEQEFDSFVVVTHKLKGLTYGSDEYRAELKNLDDALTHHYQLNSHHPEHYTHGIEDMTLLDILEMLCDWKAASERHADGSLVESLIKNRTRFGMSANFTALLARTAHELGFIDDNDLESFNRRNNI